MSYPNNSVDDGQLRAIVERLERMGEERRAIADDIKDIYAEAKGNGFDTKALKIVIRHREQDASKRQELEAVVELYLTALGMADAPREDDEPPARAPARESAKSVPIPADEADDQSTAARMDVPGSPPVIENPPVPGENGEGYPHKDSERPLDTEQGSTQSHVAGTPAGTQAPLVDTISDACQNALRLRPHCLAAMQNEITKCGGHGKVHCSTCLKAHADAEGISA